MRRGGLWVSSSAWCEKGMMRKLCKKALRAFREIKVRACVHCFRLTKPLGMEYNISDFFITFFARNPYFSGPMDTIMVITFYKKTCLLFSIIYF